jgi:DNA-binding CsgD family transcriptional regulator
VAQPIDPLSDREEEVLREVAVGHTNNEIAALLHISAAAVKTHLNHLSTKIGARNRVELVAWAWDSGRMGADHR